MLDSMKKHGITLAVFAAITTGATAIVHLLTQDTITQQSALQQKKLFDQVLPEKLYNNDVQNECRLITAPELGDNKPHHLYIAKKDNIPVAVIIETTAPDGYSGAIRLLIGADFNGMILGTRVIEHHETPGLGDKIELRHSQWITIFTGKQVNQAADPQWAVKKDGGVFDQFTGATITPRAVVNAVHRTGLLVKTLAAKLNTLPTCRDDQ